MARVLLHYDLPSEFAGKFRERITSPEFAFPFTLETQSVYSAVLDGTADTYEKLEAALKSAAKDAPKDAKIFLERPFSGPMHSGDIRQIAIRGG